MRHGRKALALTACAFVVVCFFPARTLQLRRQYLFDSRVSADISRVPWTRNFCASDFDFRYGARFQDPSTSFFGDSVISIAISNPSDRDFKALLLFDELRHLRLVFSGNSLVSIDTEMARQSFSKLGRLTEVDVISAKPLSPLVRSLASLPALETLQLIGCDSDDGAISEIRNCRRLKTLSFMGCQLRGDWIQEVKALPIDMLYLCRVLMSKSDYHQLLAGTTIRRVGLFNQNLHRADAAELARTYPDVYFEIDFKRIRAK